MENPTVAKTAGPGKCSCGLWYADQRGVDACIGNRHHDGRDKYAEKNKFSHDISTTVTICCAECYKFLTGTLRRGKYDLEIDVYPHICAVEEPEDGQ